LKLSDLWASKPVKVAFFWQIQDPGNAGTVIRSADAAGFDAVVFSTESVDVFNPKTVRATVGSLWHIPVISDVDLNEFLEKAKEHNLEVYALAGDGKAWLTKTQRRNQRQEEFNAKAQGRKGKAKKIGHVFRSEADFPYPLIP
jgi:tRNA G18 (ribose-2'-O)-methylase SpoU